MEWEGPSSGDWRKSLPISVSTLCSVQSVFAEVESGIYIKYVGITTFYPLYTAN
jgi:hypothetical protein